MLYSRHSTLIELVKAALCGYVLARYEFPGRTLLYRLIVATLFVPVASIIIPQFVLVDQLGLLNTAYRRDPGDVGCGRVRSTC